MNLDSESRAMLRDSARDWFGENCPVSAFRARRDSDGRVGSGEWWPAMAALGWPGLMVPEAQGGSGLGLAEMAIVLEEAGRTLAPAHLLSTAVGGVTALRLASPTAFTQEALAALAAGEMTVALAIDEGRHHQPGELSCKAMRVEDGWTLSGRKTSVADVTADAYLVAALAGEGGAPTLFWVPASEVRVIPLDLIDGRDHGEIELDSVVVPAEARLTAEGGDLLDQVLDHLRMGLAAEMLGSATAAFEMTVDYLKIREQFGQLIGSFQALQHRAATLYVELEVCRAVLEAALIAADTGSAELPALAAKTKALAGDVAQHVTNEAIQLHGGIGMTDEHDAGLYLKRARVTEHLYGSAAFHRDRFARLRGF